MVIQSMDDAVRACGAYGIPDYMADAVFEYVVNKRPAGGFFMAVMENDLIAAAGAADENNRAALYGWSKLVYNEFPTTCHGSRERVKAWLAKGDPDAK